MTESRLPRNISAHTNLECDRGHGIFCIVLLSHNSYSGFKSNIFLGGTGIPPTNARTVEGIYLKPDHGRHAVEDFNEPKVHSINT